MLLLPRVPAGSPAALVVHGEFEHTFGVPELLTLPRLMTSSKSSDKTTTALALLIHGDRECCREYDAGDAHAIAPFIRSFLHVASTSSVHAVTHGSLLIKQREGDVECVAGC